MEDTLELKTTIGLETEIVTLGDGELALVCEVNLATGEFVSFPGLPAEILGNAQQIADYIGPRVVAARARLAGKQAEKASILETVVKIGARYDGEIKREQNLIAWLTGQPGVVDPLSDLARSLGYDKPDAKKRTGPLGMLRFGFKKTQGGRTVVKVNDSAVALTYLKAACPAAVKVVESVLVSEIPADLELPPNASGMERIESAMQFVLD